MLTHLICSECPNGCNLSLDWKDAASVIVSDNQCSRGIGYTARALRKEKDIHVEAKEKTAHFSSEALAQIIDRWGMHFTRARYDMPIQGSPERSLFRVVVETAEGKLFVLEQIAIKNLEAKRRIAKTLAFFAQQRLSSICPYVVDLAGEHLVQYRTTFWQLAPFVAGVPLDREKYMFEGWRGQALARFLIELRGQSQNVPLFDLQKPFSLKEYIAKLARSIDLYNESVQVRANDILDFLEKDLMRSYEKLPVAFCHGDYHPMNMIWATDRIECVIDWEFTGYKKEIYDMANLIGCVGVENPKSLSGDLIRKFVADIKSSQIISDVSWQYLVEFIIALRFAWLSEWLRRRDTEMIDLELDYMHLLMENKDNLRMIWEI